LAADSSALSTCWFNSSSPLYVAKRIGTSAEKSGASEARFQKSQQRIFAGRCPCDGAHVSGPSILPGVRCFLVWSRRARWRPLFAALRDPWHRLPT
jgi:hypothetical protein